ncbi:NAD(P)-dependent oxidoreductase [Rhodobacteraceae bacterium CCMM004]|nr:NAD(P)-dependent oxidoreductase [Rhodobacteraceae bacterium CCMM004]
MADSGKPAIGFIGVGHMGHGMASCLLRDGYPLWVRGHRNRAPVDDLVARGATEAESPRAMAEECEIVHLCLPNSQSVEAVVRGEDGLMAAGRKGLIVVDTTTADPASTEALAAELEAQGMYMVDAPLGRTPKEAAEGTLDAMVGAAPEVFDRIRPVLESWAGTVAHLGPVGSAHKMKLVMNFIGMGYAALYSEALTMAARAGVAPQTVRRVIGGSRMGCGFFETFMAGAVGREAEAHKFTLANAMKDVRYGAQMAQGSGVANPMGAAMLSYYTMAVGQGHGAAYVPTLADHVAGFSGVDLAGEIEKGARDADRG